jgi:ATP-binding cassette, subfamily D (ALD), member 3
MKLLKIVLPDWKNEATVYIILLTFGLVARTYLSIWISDVNSQIVKAII